MGRIRRAQYRRRFRFFVGSVQTFDFQDRQRNPFRMPERDPFADRQRVGKTLRQIERYRNRPQLAVHQARIFEHRKIIGFTEKTRERGESAIADQFQIEQLMET